MSHKHHYEEPDLFLGARVRMSPLGRKRHPKYGDRCGVIVGQGSPSSWRVKFEERTTIQAIHRDYLEPQPASTATRRTSSNQASSRRDDIAGHDSPDGN